MEWACKKQRPLAISKATFLPCRYHFPTREPGRCRFRHKSPPSTNSITNMVLLPDMHAPCRHKATCPLTLQPQHHQYGHAARCILQLQASTPFCTSLFFRRMLTALAPQSMQDQMTCREKLALAWNWTMFVCLQPFRIAISRTKFMPPTSASCNSFTATTCTPPLNALNTCGTDAESISLPMVCLRQCFSFQELVSAHIRNNANTSSSSSLQREVWQWSYLAKGPGTQLPI